MTSPKVRRKWVGVLLLSLLGCVGLGWGLSHRAGTRDPGTAKQQLSYAMGVAIAKSLHRQQVDVDLDAVAQGMRAQLSEAPLRMSDAALREAVGSLQGELKQKQAQVMLARELRRKRAQPEAATPGAAATERQSP